MTDARRRIPAVDTLLGDPVFVDLMERYGRDRVVGGLRTVLSELRERISADKAPQDVERPERYARSVEALLAREDIPSLRPLINATGVVLHTNLGRAPLARAAVEAMTRAAQGYTNLEYDLDIGGRGSRYDHCRNLLVELTGAEDALVVNNNAAALVLALNTLARDAGVAVSRGELVEIGGGFRIPEILERSGARLVEVGSTNRTRASDYSEALVSDGVAAILKVHRSNFHMTGFTEDVSIEALAVIGRAAHVPLVYDLGSGLLADPAALGLPNEPRAREALGAGADVVVMSGDKLLGGPQAGIVLGREPVVGALRRNPLTRALRVDKVTLAGLEATLRLYHHARALEEIPILRMLATPRETLEARARALATRLSDAGLDAKAAPGDGAVGGGTYPGVTLPSWTVRLGVEDADGTASALRAGEPPVVARIEDGDVVLDMRTIAPEEEDGLVRRLREALGQGGQG